VHDIRLHRGEPADKPVELRCLLSLLTPKHRKGEMFESPRSVDPESAPASRRRAGASSIRIIQAGTERIRGNLWPRYTETAP